MRRGEIRIVKFGTVISAEAALTTPAVIVSNDGANATAAMLGHGVITVVPLATNTGRIYPFQVLMSTTDTGLACDSKAQAEQVRSIAVERIGRVVGAAPLDLMTRLDDALRLHLDL